MIEDLRAVIGEPAPPAYKTMVYPE